MIRAFEASDTEAVIDIWYQANLLAHPFLSSEFLEQERENIINIYIPNTRSWLYESNGKPVAFISMIGNEVGAIFAYPEFHGQGIGTALMQHVSQKFDTLEVEVFKANAIGRSFYKKFGFIFMEEKFHEPSNQPILRLKLECNKTLMNIPNLVSVQWLANNLDNQQLIILDASPRSNVSNLIPDSPNLQIRNARSFDMEEVFLDTTNALPNMFPDAEKFKLECQKLGIMKESFIVVYDNLGIYTAPRAWWMFKSMGHENVGVLDGGLGAWKHGGYPCEPKTRKVYPKGNMEVNYSAEQVCDANYILQNLANEKHIIIDARSPGRFFGSSPEPRPNMQSGHIPGSVNIPFRDLLIDGKMKPKAELEVIFESLDIQHKKMIFSCGSGVTACILLLAATLVNTNPKALFDGSWASWGQGIKYPVVQD